MNNIKKKIIFPKEFLFGAAIASEETEGKGITKKAKTEWDLFYEQDPSYFYDKIGNSTTNDAMNHYKIDLKMFKETGSNSFRNGFSWARLFPDEKNVNQQAVYYYHKYLKEAKKNKLTIFMTLMHFDLPGWCFEKYDGWNSLEVVESFLDFAKFCIDEFGNEIDYLVTFNEPNVAVIGGYLGSKTRWPRIYDSKKAVQVSFNQVLAHAKVVNYANSRIRKFKIGPVINVQPAIAKDGKKYDSEDKQAAVDYDLLINYSFLDPMILGKYDSKLVQIIKKENLLPKYTKEDIEEIKKIKIDFLGVNYYQPHRVSKPLKRNGNSNFLNNYFEFYHWPEMRINVFRGWEIFPKGIRMIAKIIKERYKNISWMISENGIGVQNEKMYKNELGIIQDDYRIAFVQEHLEEISKLIVKGHNCFGYHMWAMIDCWSWVNAYKNRYGFIELDLNTQKRIMKKSGMWFKEMTQNNFFYSDYKKIEEVIDLKKVNYEKSIESITSCKE